MTDRTSNLRSRLRELSNRLRDSGHYTMPDQSDLADASLVDEAIAALPDETFGESPHDITCNYRRGPLFGEGCICKVVNKHEYARMEQQLPKNPCRHTAAKAEAIRKGLGHITCGCGVTLSAQKSEAPREPLPIRKDAQ